MVLNMTMSKDELIEEIEDMCSGMLSKPEYIDEVKQGHDLRLCSTSKLYAIRKLAQIYLNECHILRKSQINDRINEIDKLVKSAKKMEDIEEVATYLNDKQWRNGSYFSPYHRLKEIEDNVREMFANGLVEGDFMITFNLKVKPFEELDISLLQEKIKLVREAQLLDRLLQRHMKKKAKCIVSDSTYEQRIEFIENQIKKIEEERS